MSLYFTLRSGILQIDMVYLTAEMKKFALIGVGGYIAPRHLKAIKETGNVLVAALDKNDAVGILDSYFPDADFFTEFERFDRHLEMLRRNKGQGVDYVSICSPNYLHDAHVRFALRIGADAICEKPLVLNPWNVAALSEFEKETGKRINTILQLRLHPAITALKERIDKLPKDKTFDIDLTYITSRGRWYMASWKGDVSKSGGIATNIGVHFFDMLSWIFGGVRKNIVHICEPAKAAGFLELDRARVRWFLSVDREDLPFTLEPGKPGTYRSIKIDGEEIEFSGGFADLHVESYRRILAGKSFLPGDVITSIKIVSDIRNAKPVGLKGDYHSMLANRGKNV
jgi:UDP-N-acetyl-2-amino-2-deoxyglucuronate dehydrogenase